MAEQKKGLFGNLFGKKKEEAEKAAEEAAAEAKKQAEVAAENAKRVAEAAKKKAEAEATKAEYEARKVADEAKREAREKLDKAKEAAKAKAEELAASRETASKRELTEKLAAEKAAQYIENYTVTSDDTLSHIALRFYGKATPAYYTLIYEHNKDVIGDNMNVIVPGQVLRIPALPEDLK